VTRAPIGNLPRAVRSLDLWSGTTLSKALTAIAVIVLVGYAVYFMTAGAHAGDAHAYWAADIGDPYTTAVNEHDAFLYSPAFLLAIGPLKLLPWEVFWPAWTALSLGVLAWLVGPVIAVLVLLPGPYSPVWVNLWYGNIAIFMAAALVLAFRTPAAWSFLVLTKVTPGIGLAWFVARREWRYLRNALLVTAAIVAVSFALTPNAWLDWPKILTSNAAHEDVFIQLPPLWLRLVAAGIIVVMGGIASARWTVVLAAVIAQPVFWFTGLAMLIAWIGLLHHRRALTFGSALRPADAHGSRSQRDTFRPEV
jgi:hypothetical protein